MARKKAHTPKLVAKLRRAEVLVGPGKIVADAEQTIGVTEPTCHRCGRKPAA